MSGRSIDKLREWVPAESLYLSGSHGFEIAGPIGSSLNFTVASQLLPEMEQALQLLQQRVSAPPPLIPRAAPLPHTACMIRCCDCSGRRDRGRLARGQQVLAHGAHAQRVGR